MAKLTLEDLDVKGKKVLMRVDFNVPLKEEKAKLKLQTTTVLRLHCHQLNMFWITVDVPLYSHTWVV
ncbi:Phosphoglycerate kinase [Weissella viridescens]|uniref:Phosphoglycerate kinase n=1 Tax=Weissella viridescens TaxID=1629 RepID=A0A380P300_WEIVI|nr:Phosphoglycerate kinase [Weissella viridescens]